MSNSTSSKYVMEFATIIPLITLGLGGIYYHSFYENLGLTWLFSQGSVSTILLSSIPLFFKIITGSTLAILLNVSFFKTSEYYLGLTLLLILCFGALGGSLTVMGFSWANFFTILESFIFIFYSFILSLTFLLAIEYSGTERNIMVSIFTLALLIIVPIVDFQASQKSDALLAGSGQFSKITFTESGLSKVPLSYTIHKNGEVLKKNIDWRILEINGDKVIIIAINCYQKVSEKKKYLVKIVEYKDIDHIF